MVAILDDGTKIISDAKSGPVMLWDLSADLSAEAIEPVPLGNFELDITQVAISPDRRWGAAPASNPVAVNDSAISQDSRILIAGSGELPSLTRGSRPLFTPSKKHG